MFDISPRDSALRYTKFSIRLVFAQPIWPDASKLAKWLFNIFTWIFMPFRLLLGIVPSKAVCHRIKDYIALTKVIRMGFSFAAEVEALARKAQRAKFESCVTRLENEMFTATPEGAWEYTRMSVLLVFTWPLPQDATRLRKIIFEVCFWIFLVSPFVMTLILFNAVYETFDDYLAFSKTFSIGVACAQVVIKMLICRAQRLRFKMLHRVVEDFLRSATSRERRVLLAYTNRCVLLHVSINMCAFFANVAMVCGPLILPQSLPVTVTYPFSVEEQPGLWIAYFHETIVGFQCASNGSIDCQTALLVWFAGARLELLAEEFENATTIREFDRCIKKHQLLLAYAEETIQASRLIVLVTIYMAGLSVVTAGVQLVTPQPFIVKSQFFVIVFGFIFELFVSAWPAENLINACNAVGDGAYKSAWAQDPIQLRKKIFLVMLQSKKHCVLAIPGLVPELSLGYYATFVSKTYSFFTALRIMLGADGD